MTRRASIETLERLAEALDAAEPRMDPPLGPRVKAALAAYRSETAPLRAREEVDAEIVRLVRAGNLNADTLTALANEPTSGPSSESAIPPVASVAGAVLSQGESLAAAFKSLDPHYGTPMGNRHIRRAVEVLLHGTGADDGAAKESSEPERRVPRYDDGLDGSRF